MKAYIKNVWQGRNKGQFRFVLKAKNGETVAISHPETYKSKSMAIQTLTRCFPQFEIVDATYSKTNRTAKKKSHATR